MADIAQLGVVVDPTGSVSGANEVNKALDSMSARAKRSMNSIAGVSGKLKEALFSIQGIVASIGTGLTFGAIVDEGADFQESLSDLSAITGVVGDDLQKLAQDAKDFGFGATTGALEVVKSFKLIASANSSLLDTEGALQAVSKEVLTLADASKLDLEPATRAVVGTLNQFQLPASEASRVINVLAAASKVGSAEVEDIAASFANSATTAGLAKISVEELAAATEVLAIGEKKGAEAGTALRNIILKLDNNVDRNLRPSVVGLADALTNLNEKVLAGTIDKLKLFGFENIDQANIILSNIPILKEWTAEVTGTSVAYEQAAIQTDNFRSAQKELSNAVKVVATEMASDLLPALTSTVDALTESVRWVRDNYEELKRFGEIVVTVGKFVAGYILIFKGIPLIATAVSGAFTALTLAWGKFQLSLGAGIGTMIAAKNGLRGIGAGATTAATAIGLLAKAVRALFIIGLVFELGKWSLQFQVVQESLVKVKAGFLALKEVMITTKAQIIAFGKAVSDLENPFKAAQAAGEGLNMRLKDIGANAARELAEIEASFQKTKKAQDELAAGAGAPVPQVVPTIPTVESTGGKPPAEEAESYALALQSVQERLDPVQRLTRLYKEDLLTLKGARAEGLITTQIQLDSELALTEAYNQQVASLTNVAEKQSELASLQEQFKEGLASGLADAAVNTRSLSEAMRSLAQEIARTIIQALILKAINAGISSFGGGAGAAAGSAAATGMQTGTDRVANNGLAFLHKDEMVVPAKSAESFRKDRRQETDQEQDKRQLNVINFVDKEMFRDWMQSNDGQDTVVNTINGNRQALGI